jgi:hypothetical protein
MSFIITQGYLSPLIDSQGYGIYAPPPPQIGDDPITAIQKWWQTNSMTLASFTSDGKLHHLQAPQGVVLPYATYFKVSDPVETFTTGYGFRRALVQINYHAETDIEAQKSADLLADAMRTLAGAGGAILTIYNQQALHVLPHSFSITIGEGLGDNGRDCWLASFELDIAFTK